MNNMICLVGRLVKDPELKESENGAKYISITLAIPRSFKNIDGVYETDFIPVKLWGGIAENTAEWCEKGDVVGIRGRVQRVGNDYTANGFPILEVIAERVTFITSKRSEE